MKFRYTIHRTDLNKMEKFFTEIVGLEKLGRFEGQNTFLIEKK